MAQRYVLDTNIIAVAIHQNPFTISKIESTRKQNGILILCPVVLYEVSRGLYYRDARKQLAFWEKYKRAFRYLDFEPEDWDEAAKEWANHRQQGKPIADADLLIGVYARRREAILVTDNTKDFALLNIPTENWRRP